MAQDALRFAQGISADHARLALLRIGAPPAIDVAQNPLLRPPFVDRQAESGFRNESVAAQRRERFARSIRLQLVVSRRDPHPATMFNTDLRRTKYMSCRMQRDFHAIAIERLAIGEAFDPDIAEAMAENRRAVPMTEINAVAGPCVIGMAMRDDGPLNRPPRIDVEIPGGTIKSGRIGDDQIHRWNDTFRR